MDENVRYLPNYEPEPPQGGVSLPLAIMLIIGRVVVGTAQVAVYLLAAIGAVSLLGR